MIRTAESGQRFQRWGVLLTFITTVGYALSGWTVIGPEEVAVVLRCGRLVGDEGSDAIRSAGLLCAWPPPFDRVIRLPAKREVSWNCRYFWQPATKLPTDDNPGEAQASTPAVPATSPSNLGLAGDLNFVSLEFTVKYQVADPVRFLLHVADPQAILESAVRGETQSILSQSSIDDLLQLTTLGNHEHTSAPASALTSLPEQIRTRAAARLRELQTGIVLTSVEVQSARPPAEVQDAFEALQTARIEQEASRDRANGLASERILEAETLAGQTIAEEQGRRLVRAAEVFELVRRFEADLHQIPALGREVVIGRLRNAALREVLENAGRVRIAPDLKPGAEFWWQIPPAEESP